MEFENQTTENLIEMYKKINDYLAYLNSSVIVESEAGESNE